MDNKEELREKLIQFEILKEETKKIENEIINFESKRAELEIVGLSLDEIKGQTGKDLLIPLGSGTFIKGQLTEDNKILINVGANVVVEKTISEAKDIIKEQMEQISKARSFLEKDLMRFIQQLRLLEPELVKLSQRRSE